MPRSDVLYVITLVASSAPVPLPVLDESHFAGLAAFRSRRIEDGRERFRIHVGYFTSMGDAELVLPLLRDNYPWAFVGPAPQSNLGSLDDTSISRFRIVRPAAKAPATAAASAPAPVAAAVAKPATPQFTVVPAVAAAAKAAAPPVVPASAVAAKPVRVATPPILPMSDAIATRPAAAAPRTATSRQPTAAPPIAAPPAAAPQRYAVQLLWSSKPIDLARIQHLGVFDGYLLYAVETRHGGSRMYGVRLGFYDDALSARLVALYVRPTFKGVVIPVSAREVESASRATIRLAGGRQARPRVASRSGWPLGAVSVTFAPGAQSGAEASL